VSSRFNIPLGRMVEPEDIAYAALSLASDFANMITEYILTLMWINHVLTRINFKKQAPSCGKFTAMARICVVLEGFC
jgi:hypothetical protein